MTTTKQRSSPFIEAQIIYAIRELDDLATGPAIADHVGRSEGYVYKVLCQMVREDKLDKGSYGKPYTIREFLPRSIRERLQQMAIADLLAGFQPKLTYKELDLLYQALWDEILKSDPITGPAVRLARIKDEAQKLIQAINEITATKPPGFNPKPKTLAQLIEEEINERS